MNDTLLEKDISPEEAAPSPPESDRDSVVPGFGLPPRPAGGFKPGEGDEPERKRRGRPPGSKNKPKDGTVIPLPSRGTNLRKSLQDTITLVGTGVYVVNQYDGAAILKGAEGLAKSLDHLAQENPAVKRALESMLTASAWGAVVTAGASIAIPIAANHRLVPPGVTPLFGCPMPEWVAKVDKDALRNRPEML